MVRPDRRGRPGRARRSPASWAFERDVPAYSAARATFSTADSVGTRLNDWNTNPISVARIRVRSPSESVRHRAARRTGAPGPARRPGPGAWSRPSTCIRVDLPRAGRAHDRDHLAGLDRDVDAAQRLDRVGLREPVGLAQVARLRGCAMSGLLFVAEGGDRVEPGRAPGGDDPGDDAEDGREGDGEERRSGASARRGPSRTIAAESRWRGPRRPRRGPTPITPPMVPITPASVMSSRTIRRRLAPIARLMPISRVRSATDIAIVLMIDRPPTIRLMRPMPTMIELKIATGAADRLVVLGAGHRRHVRAGASRWRPRRLDDRLPAPGRR